MDVQINTHSLADLQDLIPTLAAIIIGNTKFKLDKVGIKSCIFAKENVCSLCIHGCNYLAGIVFSITGQK